jgi:hypothetical protein
MENILNADCGDEARDTRRVFTRWVHEIAQPGINFSRT